MSLVFCEGFDDITAIQELEKRYSMSYPANRSSPTFETGRNSGTAAFFQSPSTSTGHYFNLPVPGILTQGILGFAFKYTQYALSTTAIWSMRNSQSSANTLSLDWTNGALRLVIYNNQNTISEKLLIPNVWYYIEWKFKLEAVNVLGDNEVRVNGETVIQLADGADANIVSENLTTAIYTYYYYDTTKEFYLDDIYLLDTSNSIEPTDYLGDCSVISLYPNGNGTTSDWTGNDGNSVNNYQQFYTPPSGDLGYVEASGINDLDLYTVADLTQVDTVHAVEFIGNAKRTKTGTDINYRPVFRINGTNYYGSGLYPSTENYSYARKPYGVQPDGSGVWTTTAVNNMEIGVGIF